MKRRKSIVFIIALFSILFFIIQIIPSIALAEIPEDQIVIDQYPQEELFQVGNTKPGDSAYRTLLIQNNNDEDILYTMQLRNDGDQMFFNELILQITYLDKLIFDGKLKDYDGEIDRPLTAKTEEILGFELKFPEELGNEFQGKRADFTLVFNARVASDSGLVGGIATGSGNPIIGADGDGSSGTAKGGILPRTATNIFTYLLIGGGLLIIGGTVSYLSKKKAPVNE